MDHEQERKIIDNYYTSRGLKRLWKGCCDCPLMYCPANNGRCNHPEIWKKQGQLKEGRLWAENIIEGLDVSKVGDNKLKGE